MASNDKVQMEVLKAIQDMVQVNVSLQEDVKTLTQNLMVTNQYVASQTDKLAQMEANQHQMSIFLKDLNAQVQAKNEDKDDKSEDFLYNSYDFLYNSYDSLHNSYEFLCNSYDFLYNSYVFLYNSYEFLYKSYDFLYKSYEF